MTSALADRDVPAVASRRAILRRGLPSVYQGPEHEFVRSLASSFETVLDPIVAMLDALPAHFDIDLAPDNVLGLVASWLGVEFDGSWSETLRRAHLARTSELARRRGTARGIELALHVAFPGLPIRVEDEGRVAAALRPEDLPPPGRGRVTVTCYAPLEAEVQSEVGRVIGELTPAHVPFRLRVRTAPRDRQA